MNGGPDVSSFTGPLTLTELDSNWREWRLEQDLIYDIGAENSGRRIVVPAGFVTDGASIPRIFWGLFPAWGKYSRASVVHDYLCSAIVMGIPEKEAPTAHQADAVFLEAMAVSGVDPISRYVMYAACRLAAILRFRQTSRIAP